MGPGPHPTGSDDEDDEEDAEPKEEGESWFAGGERRCVDLGSQL